MKIFNLKFVTIIFVFLTSFGFQACSPTKYVTEDELIVNRVKIETDNSSVKTSKLKKVVQPQPLKKIVNTISFRARIYNIPNPKKDGQRQKQKTKRLKKINDKKDEKFDDETKKMLDKRNVYYNKSTRLLNEGDTSGYNIALSEVVELDKKIKYRKEHAPELKEANWRKSVFTWYDFVRRIGQKPEIYDTVLVNHSVRQIEIYLKNQGFFDSEVTYNVDTLRKRVNISYLINSGDPLRIRSVAYLFPDSTPEMKVFFLDLGYKYKTGSYFDVSELEKYRTNLSNHYRNNGFYYFSKQLISYKIDTIGRYNNATLFVNFNNTVDKKVYKPWTINNVFVHNAYEPNIVLQNPSAYYNKLDTLSVNYEFRYPYFWVSKNKNVVVKRKHVFREVYVYSDSLYRLQDAKATYSHLSKFKIYKLTNIQFKESNDTINNTLDCEILLTPAEKMGIIFNLESTNTAVSVGGAGYTMFTHRNLFHGGEVLEAKFQLALEKQKTQDTTENLLSFNSQEFSFDLKLIVPRLLMPFSSSSFIKQNNPKTIVSAHFSYQNRPEYSRVQATINQDYFLKSSDFVSHIFTPLRISFIRVQNMSDEFEQWVNQAMLQESYDDHFIIGSKYTFTYSNQGTKGNNIYFQTNFSPAGNMLFGVMKSFGQDTIGSVYILPVVETPFAQFVKTDLDFRYYMKYNNEQQVIWRIFTGVAVPYGNSNLLPFGEKYFVGGANSIRAWQARSLGPGDYQQHDSILFANQTGDIKLVFNFEYRFNIIKFIEGAFFVDVGNIWAINSYDTRSGGIFYIDRFYKQLAIGTGVGVRLNLSFFVFRTDIGIKLADPSLIEGQRLFLMNRPLEQNDFVINIAIGYPF